MSHLSSISPLPPLTPFNTPLPPTSPIPPSSPHRYTNSPSHTQFYQNFEALNGHTFDRNRDFRNFFDDSNNKLHLLQIAKQQLFEGKCHSLLQHMHTNRRSSFDINTHSEFNSNKLYAFDDNTTVQPSNIITSNESVDNNTPSYNTHCSSHNKPSSPIRHASSLHTHQPNNYKQTETHADTHNSNKQFPFHSSCTESSYLTKTSIYTVPSSIPIQHHKELNLIVTEDIEKERGVKKKRIAIPDGAFQPLEDRKQSEEPPQLIKLIRKYPLQYNGDLNLFLESLEAETDRFLSRCVLNGASIYGPEDIYEYLLPFKPNDMDRDEFVLWCEKPLGMSADEYLDILSNKEEDTISKSIHRYMQQQIDDIGGLGRMEMNFTNYVKEATKKGKQLDYEMELWKTIRDKMQASIESKVHKLKYISKHECRLTAGYGSLRWGRILNMLNWRRGDEIKREMGFAMDLQRIRAASLAGEIKDVMSNRRDVGEDRTTSFGQNLYFEKAVFDTKEELCKTSYSQREIDQLQAIVEFTSKRPDEDELPSHLVVWKCIGLSHKSVLWKICDILNGLIYVYKYRSISNLKDEEVNVLKTSFLDAEESLRVCKMPSKAAQSITFSVGGVIFNKRYLIESNVYIPHISLDEYLYKFGKMQNEKEILKAKWIIYLLLRAIVSLGDITFILPIKLSRISLKTNDILFRAGFPMSSLNSDAKHLIYNSLEITIASQLWAEDAAIYLPTECNNTFETPNKQSKCISKIHTWMIGVLLYRMTCELPNLEKPSKFDFELCGDKSIRQLLERCLIEDVEMRPTMEELLEDVVFIEMTEKNRIQFVGDEQMQLDKIRFAMEAFPDMEAIVNQTLKGDEKGVDIYEADPMRDAVETDSEETCSDVSGDSR